MAGWLASGMGRVEGNGTVRCITINEMNEFLELAALNNHPSASPLPCMYYDPYHSSAYGWLDKPLLGSLGRVGNYCVVQVVEKRRASTLSSAAPLWPWVGWAGRRLFASVAGLGRPRPTWLP